MTDPAEFFRIEEDARRRIDDLLRPLNDEQLDSLYDLFHPTNHSSIPFRYWGVAARVRAHIQRERQRREKESND